MYSTHNICLLLLLLFFFCLYFFFLFFFCGEIRKISIPFSLVENGILTRFMTYL